MKRTRTRRSRILHLAQRHPWITAAAVVLLCSLPGWLLFGWSGLSIRAGLVHHAALTVLAVLVLTYTRWWSEVGLNGPGRWRDLHLAAIPLAAMLLFLPGMGPVGMAQFLPYAGLSFLVALQREVWFRGILFRTLVPTHGPCRTVELTALLFGLTQMMDLVAGAAPGVTLVKALACTLSGYVLGALRLRTRSLWPGVVVATLFHMTIYLERFREAGEMLPMASDRLSRQVLVALLVYVAARLWMRRAKAKEAAPVETEAVRAS